MVTSFYHTYSESGEQDGFFLLLFGFYWLPLRDLETASDVTADGDPPVADGDLPVTLFVLPHLNHPKRIESIVVRSSSGLALFHSVVGRPELKSSANRVLGQ